MIQDYSINIIEYGAAGDGVCDDAEVIQSAIDELAKRGGGKIFFPYTPHGYRIARPADEKSRAQLVIPPGCHNIVLAGEMPCRVLNDYMIRPPIPQLGLNEPTSFAIKNDNVFLFSDWDAPEETMQHAKYVRLRYPDAEYRWYEGSRRYTFECMHHEMNFVREVRKTICEGLNIDYNG